MLPVLSSILFSSNYHLFYLFNFQAIEVTNTNDNKFSYDLAMDNLPGHVAPLQLPNLHNSNWIPITQIPARLHLTAVDIIQDAFENGTLNIDKQEFIARLLESHLSNIHDFVALLPNVLNVFNSTL